MNNETLNFGFTDIENTNVHFIKLSEEVQETLGFNTDEKTIWNYLNEYLNDKKTYQYLRNEFYKAIHKTIPKEVRDKCLYCKGNDKSVKQENRKCSNYNTEGQINEFFALTLFTTIIENNKHLITEKQVIKNLTIKLYESFLFKDGRVFFNMRKITMYCLEQGFLTLSQVFSQNDKIKNLQIINESIEYLELEYLNIKMFGEKEPYHIEPQKKFLKTKRNSIKEQIKIDKLTKSYNQQAKHEPISNVKLKINPHIEIFKNDIGYTLFLDLHNIYKSKQNHLANYSFVFYALENDYLVCSGNDFKKFISTLDIHIDKIDTRQSGTNNRTPLFNSIQEKYLQ